MVFRHPNGGKTYGYIYDSRNLIWSLDIGAGYELVVIYDSRNLIWSLDLVTWLTQHHNLRQQKFNMVFRPAKCDRQVDIYDSRNLIWSLDLLLLRIPGYIYDSRNLIWSLDVGCLTGCLLIYDSRNLIWSLDYFIYTQSDGSTTVEI